MSMGLSSPTTSLESNSSEEISLWKPEDGLTGTLTFGIQTFEEGLDDLEAAWNGEYDGPVERYDYPSYEAFHKGLSPNRMSILRAMMGQGPLSIREIARRVGRDFKGVHSDVTSMFTAGLLYKSEDGRMVFPFDSIRVDFTIGPKPAAAAV